MCLFVNIRFPFLCLFSNLYSLMHIAFLTIIFRKILVSHTPHVNANSVAEWTVMLMLCAGRRLPEATAAVKK